MNNLRAKIRKNYLENKQWLNLESMYEDSGKLTEQTICLRDNSKNECIFCVNIQTFKNLPSGWESKPYLIFDSQYNEFNITIPHFKYLTKKDLADAIYFIIRENLRIMIFNVKNVKIDGWNIAEFRTVKNKNYQFDNDDLKMMKENVNV